MPESLGTLLKKSWSYYRAHIKPILIGAIIFGVAMGASEAFVATNMINGAEERLGGVDIAYLEELSERMEAGDMQAYDEMVEALGVVDIDGQVDEEAMEMMAGSLMVGLLPAFGLMTIFMLVITLMSSTYYWLLALNDTQSTLQLLRQTPRLILPIFGIWIWSFLRSFAWIPFIGVIPGIIIGPRLCFSSIILIEENKGVMESVRLSYERTRGYWGKIVGNTIVMLLCTFVVMLALMAVLFAVGSIVPAAERAIQYSTSGLYAAYFTIFLVNLSRTITAYPMRPQKTV